MNASIRTFEDGSTIETYNNGGYAVHGRQAVEAYRLVWLKTYLPFEIRTGMVMSRNASALDVARSVAGINFRNRKQAMAWLDTITL